MFLQYLQVSAEVGSPCRKTNVGGLFPDLIISGRFFRPRIIKRRNLNVSPMQNEAT